MAEQESIRILQTQDGLFQYTVTQDQHADIQKALKTMYKKRESSRKSYQTRKDEMMKNQLCERKKMMFKPIYKFQFQGQVPESIKEEEEKKEII